MLQGGSDVRGDVLVVVKMSGELAMLIRDWSMKAIEDVYREVGSNSDLRLSNTKATLLVGTQSLMFVPRAEVTAQVTLLYKRTQVTGTMLQAIGEMAGSKSISGCGVSGLFPVDDANFFIIRTEQELYTRCGHAGYMSAARVLLLREMYIRDDMNWEGISILDLLKSVTRERATAYLSYLHHKGLIDAVGLEERRVLASEPESVNLGDFDAWLLQRAREAHGNRSARRC